MIDNTRIAEVLAFLEKHGLGYELHTHPPLPTIELALEYWKEIDSVHCKNLFFRNHKGNRHYLVVLMYGVMESMYFLVSCYKR